MPLEEPEISESEAAEALAVSWKERRTEIAKVNQARAFSRTSATITAGRRSFRNEIDELKRRTKCRKCGRVGHWARECRSQPADSATASSSTPSAAGYVQVEEHEVSFAGAAEPIGVIEIYAAGLSSSGGCGVVDTGCGKILIGEDTPGQVEAMLAHLLKECQTAIPSDLAMGQLGNQTARS